MKMQSRSRKLLAVLALAGLASTAQADVVTVDAYEDNYDLVESPTYSGMAALWKVENLTLGDSFLAYCLELAQGVDQQGSQNYSRVSYAPNGNMEELYDRFYAQSLTDADQAVGFQLALWQLSGQLPDASDVESTIGATAVAVSMVDTVLHANTSYQPGRYQYYRWTNGDHQDLLQVVPAGGNEVPEPQTHALMLGGLGMMAMAAAARRRKNQDKR